MSEIWVSDELIAIADISDYMGDKIFDYVNEAMIGCLIFCDLNANANWQNDNKITYNAAKRKNSNTQDE